MWKTVWQMFRSQLFNNPWFTPPLPHPTLKGTGHWTPLVLVKDQYSHLVFPNIWVSNYLFLKPYITSEGAVSHISQRGVSQHMHKQQICEHFGSIGHQSCRRITKEKTTVLYKQCAFRCLTWSLSYLSEKLPISQTLRSMYFRGSRFSQCCILSTSLHCSLPK